MHVDSERQYIFHRYIVFTGLSDIGPLIGDVGSISSIMFCINLRGGLIFPESRRGIFCISLRGPPVLFVEV